MIIQNTTISKNICEQNVISDDLQYYFCLGVSAKGNNVVHLKSNK